MNKKQKYNIGDKVYILNGNIEEKEIVAVTKNDKEFKYLFNKNSCGGWSETEIFKTRKLAELAQAKLLQNAKFKIGDIVIVLENYYDEKDKSKWDIKDIDIIYKIRLNNWNEIEYGVNKKLNYIDEYIYDWVNELRLIKITNKKIIKEMFNIKEELEEMEELNNKIDVIEKRIRNKTNIVEEELKRKYVNRYRKRYILFGERLYKNLMEFPE